jgi:hypothetical protein
MADEDGRIKIGEITIRFVDVDPTQKLIDASADRLAQLALDQASLLGADFRIVVVVDEGSLRERISLYVGIAGFAVSIVAADYSVAARNLSVLYDKVLEFSAAVTTLELQSHDIPAQEIDGDRSVVIRRRTTSLDRVRKLLAAKAKFQENPRLPSSRGRLVDTIGEVVRSVPSVEEKRDLISYLNEDAVVHAVLSAELGPQYEEELIAWRPPSANRAAEPRLAITKPKASIKRRRRSRLKPARREFTT